MGRLEKGGTIAILLQTNNRKRPKRLKQTTLAMGYDLWQSPSVKYIQLLVRGEGSLYASVEECCTATAPTLRCHNVVPCVAVLILINRSRIDYYICTRRRWYVAASRAAHCFIASSSLGGHRHSLRVLYLIAPSKLECVVSGR